MFFSLPQLFTGSVRLVLAVAFCSAVVCEAQVFTYTDNGADITITGLVKPAKGSVVVPATLVGKPVVALQWSAFIGQTGMTAISLPASLTQIGDSAFANCEKLRSVTIPKNAQLGNRVFDGCFALASIAVAPGSTFYSAEAGVLYDAAKTTIVRYPIGKKGSSFVIPDSVTTIASGAFFNAYLLRSVTLPSSLQTIGDSAFAYCNALEAVTIGQTVTAIGDGAFKGCSSMNKFTVDPANANYSSPNGVLFNKAQTELLSFPPDSTLTEFSVPEGVTQIKDNAFQDCSNLESVNLPASLKSFGFAVFSGASVLTSITVSPGSTSYSSVEGVLFDASKTTLIALPPGKEGDYVVPNGVTTLRSSSFVSGSLLTSLTLAASTTNVQGNFFGCSELAQINVPPANTTYMSVDGVLYQKLSKSLVAVPQGITGHVTIPSGATSIGSLAFFDSGVMSVRIPASVKQIDTTAFLSATNLRFVEFEGNAPAFTPGTFDAAAPGFVVRYLDGASGFTSPQWMGYPTVKMAAFPPPQVGVRAAQFLGVTQTDAPTTGSPTEMQAFLQESALISVTATANLSFTGSLSSLGKKFPFKGAFDGTLGNATVVVDRKLQGNATISLQYFGEGRGRVTGSLSTPQGTAPFELNPLASDVPGGSQYTVSLEKTLPVGGTNPGNGYATIVFDSKGVATVTLRLADGAGPVVLKVPAINDGSASWVLPVYAPLYTGSTGAVAGNLLIPKNQSSAGQNVFGTLDWMRPANPAATFLPAGFFRELNAYGETYSPEKGISLLTGAATAASFNLNIDPSGQVLPATLSQPGNWPATNVPTFAGTIPKGLTLKLDAKTGILTGTFQRTVNGKAVSTTLQGVVFDRSGTSYAGSGFFLTETGSGLFLLQ